MRQIYPDQSSDQVNSRLWGVLNPIGSSGSFGEKAAVLCRFCLNGELPHAFGNTLVH